MVEQNIKGERRGLTDLAVLLKHPLLQKLYNKRSGVVKALQLGEDWKRSNIIFIVSSVTKGAAGVKLTEIMKARKDGQEKLHKECLITVGATAVFQELIQAALEPDTLTKFREHGFTTINFQCGKSLNIFHDLKPDASGLELKAFDFNKDGLHEEIKACKAKDGASAQGLAISHAGKCHSQT